MLSVVFEIFFLSFILYISKPNQSTSKHFLRFIWYITKAEHGLKYIILIVLITILASPYDLGHLLIFYSSLISNLDDF